jgi:hypothetical protein
MRYRDARLLSEGDSVIRKQDKQVLTVQDIECYGQHKTVKINCLDINNKNISVLNDEIE